MYKPPIERADTSVQKLAVITLHAYLPSFEDQIGAARDWGVPKLDFHEGDVSPVWIDDVRNVKATYWPSYLPERHDLLNAYAQNKCPDHVDFFANPLCVGFSKAHAQSVIDVLFNADVGMYVHDAEHVFRAGQDLSGFWKEHSNQLKNARMVERQREK